MRRFKAASSRLVRRHTGDWFAWQRNYYEHIIRDENDLNRIRRYIANNLSRWAEDENNPDVSFRPSEEGDASYGR